MPGYGPFGTGTARDAGCKERAYVQHACMHVSSASHRWHKSSLHACASASSPQKKLNPSQAESFAEYLARRQGGGGSAAAAVVPAPATVGTASPAASPAAQPAFSHSPAAALAAPAAMDRDTTHKLSITAAASPPRPTGRRRTGSSEFVRRNRKDRSPPFEAAQLWLCCLPPRDSRGLS